MAALFQSGADEPLSYGFTGTAVATLQALGLTSGGVALSYAIAGNTVTASAPAGNTVFTFAADRGDGSWTFTLVDQLDHAAGNAENDLMINLGAIVQATDFDGDTVVGNAGGLVITVDDDTPIAILPDHAVVTNSGAGACSRLSWTRMGRWRITTALTTRAVPYGFRRRLKTARVVSPLVARRSSTMLRDGGLTLTGTATGGTDVFVIQLNPGRRYLYRRHDRTGGRHNGR